MNQLQGKSASIWMQVIQKSSKYTMYWITSSGQNHKWKIEESYKVNDNHGCKYPKAALLKLHHQTRPLILLYVCPFLEAIVSTSRGLKPKTKGGWVKQNRVMFHHIHHITKERHKDLYYNNILEITKYLENKIISIILKVFCPSHHKICW